MLIYISNQTVKI